MSGNATCQELDRNCSAMSSTASKCFRRSEFEQINSSTYSRGMSASLRRTNGIAQEDDVGFGVPSPDQKLLAVRRPVKPIDMFGGKMGDLAARFAIERLEPEVVLIFFPQDGINQAKCIEAEVRRSADGDNDAGVRLESFSRRAERRDLE